MPKTATQQFHDLFEARGQPTTDGLELSGKIFEAQRKVVPGLRQELNWWLLRGEAVLIQDEQGRTKTIRLKRKP